MRLHPLLRKKSPGQALIVIIATLIGMLLFLGLMLDLGQIFLAKAYLRRASDAASLAAAAQFRQNHTQDQMEAAAREVSHLNNIDPDVIHVNTCNALHPDAALCLESGNVPRKLVRVTIGMTYPLTFLSLIGISNIYLEEASTSEAASLDLVLVLDVSESMTWDKPKGDPLRDPSVCNTGTAADGSDQCKPFYYVKDAAKQFINKVLDLDAADEQDRIAIVTFANGWQGGILGTMTAPLDGNGWTRTKQTAIDYINTLTVYDPVDICFAPSGENSINPPNDDTKVSPCRYYAQFDPDNPITPLIQARNFAGISCPQKALLGDMAVSACGTTNLGGGLYLAGIQFPRDKRLEALWVVVALTDGAVNSTFTTYEKMGEVGNALKMPVIAQADIATHLQFGFCPADTYVSGADIHRVWCQDGDADTFHSPMTASDFDASDFTRYQANFVSCAARNEADGCDGIQGQGAVLFSIGLGDAILALDADPINPVPYGGYLLRYMAAVGDDGDPDTKNPDCEADTTYTVSCGNYFYAAGGADLTDVFNTLASRIFTRLTQ